MTTGRMGGVGKVGGEEEAGPEMWELPCEAEPVGTVLTWKEERGDLDD